MMKFLDLDSFSFDKLQIGDLVSNSIIDHFSNQQDPVLMWSCCYQLGGAVNHRVAPDGKLKPTYYTFRQSVYLESPRGPLFWEFCGECFFCSTKDVNTI